MYVFMIVDDNGSSCWIQYTYVCMHVFYVHTYVHTYVCVYECMYVCAYMAKYCTFICMYVRVCI